MSLVLQGLRVLWLGGFDTDLVGCADVTNHLLLEVVPKKPLKLWVVKQPERQTKHTTNTSDGYPSANSS